jgi:hypothetical protein
MQTCQLPVLLGDCRFWHFSHGIKVFSPAVACLELLESIILLLEYFPDSNIWQKNTIIAWKSLVSKLKLNTPWTNLVPRACDPREGTWGSGIIRRRKPGILGMDKIELHIPYQRPIRFLPEMDYPRASRSFPRIAGSGNEIVRELQVFVFFIHFCTYRR